MANSDVDLMRGTLDLVVLRALSWGPKHGLAVLRWIESVSRQQLRIEEGALYPALHRLEERRAVEGTWGYTERGRPAKFYRLTTKGRRELTDATSRWERYSAVMGLVLGPAGESA